MSASVSAEEIKKMMTGNTTEQYLGSYGNNSPLLDLVNRLSGQLNQQTAESNLYRGGAGYGGSFMNADQVAAREAGGKLNAKPYGGWGGYGSNNSTMTNQPNPGAPDIVYNPQGGGPPDAPPAGGPPPGGWPEGGDPGNYGPGGGTYIPNEPAPPRDPYGNPTGGGGVRTPGSYGEPDVPAPPRTGGGTGTAPPRGGYAPPGTVTPPVRGGQAPGAGEPPVGAPPRRTGGTNSAYVGENPYEAFAGQSTADMNYAAAASSFGLPVGSRPSTSGARYSAPPQRRDPAKNPWKKTDPEYEAWNAGVGWDANEGYRQDIQNPQVREIYERLIAEKGLRTDANLTFIQQALDDGASTDLIVQNLGAAIDAFGPNALSVAHGVIGRGMTKAGLESGQWLKNAKANMGMDPGNWTPQAGAASSGGGQQAPGRGGATGNTGNTRGTGAPGMTGEAMTMTVPPNENPNVFVPLPGDGGGSGDNPGGGGGGGADGGGTGHGGGAGSGSGGGGGASGNNWGVKKNQLNAPGKNWGPQPNPPKGAQPGDYWQKPDGTIQTLGYSGNYHTVTLKDGRFDFANDDRIFSDLPNDKSESALPPGLRVAPQQKVPGASVTPKIGQTGIIGYDTQGNPIYNDNFLFEQGDNGYGEGDVTPDAWSNSPDWRPEEPTGGVYGAYTDLAGGKMTDYENAIGQKWRDMATNPATQEDKDYYGAILDYNRTPGKGIDEAYGAYNTMINSNGYSAAEKGAMEGSAVAGVSNGFQQANDEMRRQAARTNNPAAAYAAMASGGAAYGATLGETNRQNQIKFADEAQRRKEEGASGMVNVAGLANAKAQFGLGAQGEYAREQARKKEAAVKGMGDYATFGRGLQAQGIAGLQGMMDKSDANKNNTYAQIAAILGTNTGQRSTGSSDTKQFGWNAGVTI